MTVEAPERPPSHRTETPSESVLARRRKRLMWTGCTTLGAFLLLMLFLMPLGYGGVTALKDKNQVSDPNGPILPVSADVFEYEGQELKVYAVPMDDGTERELALLQPGRESSVFIDPENPGAGEIAWEGRWRTLQPVTGINPQWGNFAESWNAIDFLRLIGWTLFYAVSTVIATVVSSAIVAYGFARFRFPFQGVLFGLLLATILLPPAVTLVPKSAVSLQMGWFGHHLTVMPPPSLATQVNAFLLPQ